MCAGILDAMRKCYGLDYELYYRFGSYDIFEPVPAHVFVVMKYRGKEYWLDPVLKTFDSRSPDPIYFKDKKINKKMLARIYGLTQNPVYPEYYQNEKMAGAQVSPSNPPGGTLYDKVAGDIGKSLNLVTSNIPFVSLAQGLIKNFFGPGGISDWITPAGILNELKSAIFGRLYRGGQYSLGERFRYYVLGENIHTRDADVVTDPVVTTAITTFSVGFGVPVTDNADLDNLSKGVDQYIQRYVTYGGVNPADINRQAVERAVTLKQKYFPGPEAGNYNPAGTAPQKWDLNNFNKIPYVAPIPDFSKDDANMWKGTYTGKIPDGEVKEGIVIAGNLSTGVVPPLKTGGITAGTWLLIGAVAVGGYLLLRKNRR